LGENGKKRKGTRHGYGYGDKIKKAKRKKEPFLFALKRVTLEKLKQG